MILFMLVTAFAIIYNISYSVYQFKRKRILSGLGAGFAVLLLVLAIGLAYNAV